MLSEIPTGVEPGGQMPGDEIGYIPAGTVEMRIKDGPTLRLHTADPFLISPRAPRNASDVGAETGRML